MGKYETKIPEIKEKIVKEIQPEIIILFGSYAWGKPTEDSDVDFFIIQKTDLPKSKRNLQIRKKLLGSGVPMDIIVYTPEELEQSINKTRNLFIEDIVRNGKVLYKKSKLSINLPSRPLTILQ